MMYDQRLPPPTRVGSNRVFGRIAGNFLSLQAWEDAVKCAMKAEGMKWVQGRMPPAA